MRPLRVISAILLFLLPSAGVLEAQGGQEADVRRDPVTGDYLVTIYDDSLEPREIRIVPADQVEPRITVEIERLPEGWIRYSYSTEVDPSSRLGLRTLEVDCPEDAPIRGLRARVAREGSARELNTTWDGPSCLTSLGAAPLSPGGGPLSFHLETRHRPAPGDARAIGATSTVRWPTTDPIPQNDAAREFIRSINGIDGGWRTLSTLVPARAPASFDEPSEGLAMVERDLEAGCGDRGWITDRGVCRSLEAQLDAASRFLERGRTEAARGQLRAFLDELEAQRDQHVNENAYWLLRTNCEFLLERLEGER